MFFDPLGRESGGIQGEFGILCSVHGSKSIRRYLHWAPNPINSTYMEPEGYRRIFTAFKKAIGR